MVEFHPDAEAEFLAAVEYYETRQPGLGRSFADEVLATVENVAAFPEAWPLVARSCRRCLTNRFPYGLIYSVESDRIFVLAVMHLRRRPGWWKSRRGS